MEGERKSSRVQLPCAACRCLRRKCKGKECFLAPCFPPQDPHKFMAVQRVFGASNVMKLLGEVEEGKRIDAANSLAFEASMRWRDPVYGCAGLVYNLQRCVTELRAQLAACNAQIQVLQLSSSSPQMELMSPLLECEETMEFDWEWPESTCF